MRFDEMKAIGAKMFEIGRQNEREYKISERAHVLVDFLGTPKHPLVVAIKVVTALSAPPPLPPPPLGYPDVGLPIALTSLTPAELVKFAEVKGMIDQWKAGTLEDLLPSTSDEVRAALRKADADGAFDFCGLDFPQ